MKIDKLMLVFCNMNESFNELSRFNYWKDRLPECGVARKSYTNRILGYVGNKLVKVLVGQRGAGKGTLLRQIARYLIEEGVSPRNVLYINKVFTDSGAFTVREDLEGLLSTYLEKVHPIGKIYLLIEEIQNIEGWEHFVHTHSQDNVTSCELFVSGSHRSMLVAGTDSLLLKHTVSFEILPFSYTEYVESTRVEASGRSYATYMEGGLSLPELSSLPSEEARRKAVSAIRDAVLLRDVVQRYRIKDARLLEDVWIYLSAHLSELVSVTDLVRYFSSQNRKTSYDTVSNYIRALEDTFLIHRVERFQIRNKEVVSGSCKYYINDWALMRYLYPFFVQEQAFQLENQLYLELRRFGYSVFTGVLRNKTVDFVARKGDRVLYLQCAPSLSDEFLLEQLYTSLEAIQDNYEKWVVSLDEVTLPSKEGIRHIQAWRLAEVL